MPARALGRAGRATQTQVLFDPGINFVSFFSSAAIGVLFGYFPARQAARLDAIRALRDE